MLEVDSKKRDLEEVITEWVAANEAMWSSWVSAAM